MSQSISRQGVIFGGFRTATLEDSCAADTFEVALDLERSTNLINVWEGPGDSLEKRHERSIRWLTNHLCSRTELHILGYSMGCQLATKFAREASQDEKDRFSLGSLTLIAPDPKYRNVKLDFLEKKQGVASAYDEARRLWATRKSAGPQFVSTLREVSKACELGCRVVLCRKDGVSEWHENVSVMAMELNDCPSIRWLEVREFEEIDADGVYFRLDPGEVSHIECADRIHAALWYRLTFT